MSERVPQLPEEMYEEIISCLRDAETKDLLNCRLVNRSFQIWVDRKTRLWSRMDIFKAIREGNFDVCQKMIDSRTVDLDSVTDQPPPLHEKNQENKYGLTPLHWAAQAGRLRICQLILENVSEKNPKARKFFGYRLTTPLQLASRAGHTRVCKLILDSMQEESLTEAMQWTSQNFSPGNWKIFNMILEHVQERHIRLDFGAILRLAAKEGNGRICLLILESVKEINHSDKDGNTPLHLAAKFRGRHPDEGFKVFQLIFTRSLEKNHANKLGLTPLHLAAEGGHSLICRLVVNTVADKNPADTVGITPLHLAAREGHLKICQTILMNVGEINPSDRKGITPLALAERRGNPFAASYHNLLGNLQYMQPTNNNKVHEHTCQHKRRKVHNLSMMPFSPF